MQTLQVGKVAGKVEDENLPPSLARVFLHACQPALDRERVDRPITLADELLALCELSDFYGQGMKRRELIIAER